MPDVVGRVGECTGRDATDIFIAGRRVATVSKRQRQLSEVDDCREAEEVGPGKHARVDVDHVERLAAVEVVREPVLSLQDRWVELVWVPAAHQRDHLDAGLFGGEGEDRGAVEVLGVEWRAVIRKLHVLQRSGEVAPVEQVADDHFDAVVAKGLSPVVVSVNHPANGVAATDQIECSDRPGPSGGCCDEHSRLHRLASVRGTTVVMTPVSTS